MSDLFDEMDDYQLTEKIKPFYKVYEKKNDKELLAWLNQVKDALTYNAKSRTLTQRDNLTAYRGLSLNRWDRRRDSNPKRINRLNKFIVNHLRDLTETKVSQMTRLKPAVEVLPSNGEYEDKASAKVVGLLIKHLFYTNNLDFLAQQMHRHARIFGETFSFIDYDKSKGDLDPMYVDARNKGIKELQMPDGSTYDMSTPLKTGDVSYDLEVPWRVLLQRKDSLEDVEYNFRITTESVEK